MDHDSPPGPAGQRHLAIIWHSRTGAAAAMARAAYTGALAAAHPARMIAAGDATAQDMLAASAYLFVCPENLAAVTGAMKEFLDACYYPLLGPVAGRAYATAIAAGSDGTGAQRQLDRIATGWRLRRVADPLVVCTHAQTPEAILAPKVLHSWSIAACHALGEALATGLDLGVF